MVGWRVLREVAYGLRGQLILLFGFPGVEVLCHLPTFEVASVNELSMVDLPLEGFPTRPMSGSRGILWCFDFSLS